MKLIANYACVLLLAAATMSEIVLWDALAMTTDRIRLVS